MGFWVIQALLNVNGDRFRKNFKSCKAYVSLLNVSFQPRRSLSLTSVCSFSSLSRPLVAGLYV